jgi:phospholipid N-methyltransferase
MDNQNDQLRATYSPDDNKLRLYPGEERLPEDQFKALKNAGFRWARLQRCFFAQMWTPEREDLLIEFCGEVADDDRTLTDRAEERADRFDGYSEKRADEAEATTGYAESITGSLSDSDPVIIGRHDMRKAERVAKKAERALQKAEQLWDTAEYWERRAAGALRHAKYKETPAVRARRIKTIEAEQRKFLRTRKEAERFISVYAKPENKEKKLQDGRLFLVALLEAFGSGLSYEEQKALGNGALSLDNALKLATERHTKNINNCDRWLSHLSNRLAYEKAMLADQGASDLLKPAPKPKQLPLCNYDSEEPLPVIMKYNSKGDPEMMAVQGMTMDEYQSIWSDYRGTATVSDSHRVRVFRTKNHWSAPWAVAFITDKPVKNAPKAENSPAAPQSVSEGVSTLPAGVGIAKAEKPAPAKPQKAENQPPARKISRVAAAKEKREALKNRIGQGVEIVAVDQLFQTPVITADSMAFYLDLAPGQRVLESSAGLGRLLDAILKYGYDLEIVAQEINVNLFNRLRKKYEPQGVKCLHDDFLISQPAGEFDRIIINPPFVNAEDIKHILMALSLLKKGGRLVALCANGPRQQKALKPLATHWEELPPGSFSSEGTGVSVALLVIDR